MKQELKEECDYIREARFMRTFGSSEYLGKDPRFKVPWVWEGSTDKVLVMEFVDGLAVGEAERSGWSQKDRNDVSVVPPAKPHSFRTDCGQRHIALSPRALQLSYDANRPQLFKLSLESPNS